MTIDAEAAGVSTASKYRNLLADLFEVQDFDVGPGGLVRFRGRLLVPSDQAYSRAAERLRPLGCTPFFRRQGQSDVIQILPRIISASSSRGWGAALLFGLTVLSVLYVGAGMSAVGPSRGLLATLLSGAPFGAALLGILAAHELGHYLVSRHYGVPRSLPYFIPLPLPPFGTLGAVIQLKAPPTNRRVLLAIAAAGPLAGLAVALPLLAIGLRLSPVTPPIEGGVLEGNSILYAVIKYLIFGRWLPAGGLDVNLHPMAFGAWAGLFVTGLNLIPAGQLDGGHIAYVLIGERARALSLAVAAGLVLLGVLVYPGWFLWAGLVYVLGRTFATPLDEITLLDRRGVALAVAMLIIFVLVFVPIPLRPIVPAALPGRSPVVLQWLGLARGVRLLPLGRFRKKSRL